MRERPRALAVVAEAVHLDGRAHGQRRDDGDRVDRRRHPQPHRDARTLPKQRAQPRRRRRAGRLALEILPADGHAAVDGGAVVQQGLAAARDAGLELVPQPQHLRAAHLAQQRLVGLSAGERIDAQDRVRRLSIGPAVSESGDQPPTTTHAPPGGEKVLRRLALPRRSLRRRERAALVHPAAGAAIRLPAPGVPRPAGYGARTSSAASSSAKKSADATRAGWAAGAAARRDGGGGGLRHSARATTRASSVRARRRARGAQRRIAWRRARTRAPRRSRPRATPRASPRHLGVEAGVRGHVRRRRRHARRRHAEPRGAAARKVVEALGLPDNVVRREQRGGRGGGRGAKAQRSSSPLYTWKSPVRSVYPWMPPPVAANAPKGTRARSTHSPARAAAALGAPCSRSRSWHSARTRAAASRRTRTAATCGTSRAGGRTAPARPSR